MHGTMTLFLFLGWLIIYLSFDFYNEFSNDYTVAISSLGYINLQRTGLSSLSIEVVYLGHFSAVSLINVSRACWRAIKTITSSSYTMSCSAFRPLFLELLSLSLILNFKTYYQLS